MDASNVHWQSSEDFSGLSFKVLFLLNMEGDDRETDFSDTGDDFRQGKLTLEDEITDD